MYVHSQKYEMVILGSTEWLLRNQIFWGLAPCSWVTFADVSKKRTAWAN